MILSLEFCLLSAARAIIQIFIISRVEAIVEAISLTDSWINLEKRIRKVKTLTLNLTEDPRAQRRREC